MKDSLLGKNRLFKDLSGNPLTKTINQTDVKPTVWWLEQLTGLELRENLLGSTGSCLHSNDLDLGVSSEDVSKDEVVNRLVSWVKSHRLNPKDFIKVSDQCIHFKTPILGNPDKGFVQTDFMFLPDLEWSKFSLRVDPESEFSGKDRNVMLRSIAEYSNMRLDLLSGLYDQNRELVTTDPDCVAQILLGKNKTGKDLRSVESIVAALQEDPNMRGKISAAKDHFKRHGVLFMESEVTSDVHFLARLRDRLVNKGMKPLIEEEQSQEISLNEGARIEHLEDLIFERGSKGVDDAMRIVKSMARNTSDTTSPKWDGKPAIIWGRMPNGDFVLTDKSGFNAKRYDGLAKTPEQLAAIMKSRKGDRGPLIDMYKKIFPILEKATPKDFRGFILGDLLYSSTPDLIDECYTFRPNFVEYRIPVNSPMGQRIKNSVVGIAAHTKYRGPGEEPKAIRESEMSGVPELFITDSSGQRLKDIDVDSGISGEITNLYKKYGSTIDRLFNPESLRENKVTDLPGLCKKYINHRISSDYTDLLPGFIKWLKDSVTPNKFNNIISYLSNSRNQTAISAAFSIFLMLSDLKTDILEQLDSQEPGHEGWVADTSSGRVKFVNRFVFSRGNRELNNKNRV